MTMQLAFKHNPTRNDVILQHYPLVERVAQKLLYRLPPSVDGDDLSGAGVIGLIEAYERFDGSKGIPFRFYVEIRIRGAMLDFLRKHDWVPRTVRQRANELATVHADLHIELGRKPTLDEWAHAMNMSVEDLEKYIRHSQVYAVTSLDVPFGKENDLPLVEMVASDTSCAQQKMETEERKATIRQAIAQLSEQEQIILTRHYYGHESLRSIARELNVTDSRIYQIRNVALRKMGAILIETA